MVETRWKLPSSKNIISTEQTVSVMLFPPFLPARGLVRYKGEKVALTPVIYSYNFVSLLVLQDILVTAPKIARGWEWYKSDQHESMLIKFTCRYSSHWCRKS